MSAITTELMAFANSSATTVSHFKQIATALPANTAQVWPGGATFNSIQAAINSITGASPQEQYQVAVGSGTYNENIVMKDYVYVIGTGPDATIITAPSQSSPFNGVVNSASGGGISEVTINAPGAGWGNWPVGIKICGAGKFHISGVIINAGAGSNGDNVRGITNNTGSYTGSVVVGECTINATGDSDSTAVGVELFGDGMLMLINLCTIQVVNARQNFGVSTAVQANVTLEGSKIIASTFALYDSDSASPITANQCTIDGPVSAGVVVNN